MTSTVNYGAITEIIDNRTSFSMVDSSGTDFTFEVYPLHITENKIREILNPLQFPNLWFIDFITSIVRPRDAEIQKALNDGLLLKLSISGFIVDNYGISHNIEFNKETESYTIQINNITPIIKNNAEYVSLSDLLIDFVKESDNKRMAINAISPGRLVLGKLFSKIKDLEDRLRILEQK